MRKPKNRKALFIKVCQLWLENELQCISEWCVTNKTEARKRANNQFEQFLKWWDEME